MPAAQRVILISANIDNSAILRLDDETTHGLAQVTDTVMSLGRHSLIVCCSDQVFARFKERVSGQSGGQHPSTSSCAGPLPLSGRQENLGARPSMKETTASI